MDEEENKRRKEEQEDSGIKKGIKTAESGAKKLSKFVKTARRVIAFILAHIWILKILLPLLVIGILVLIFSLKDDDGNNRLASVASKALLEDKEITDIAYDEDNGYYFTISDNVVKKFIEELEKAYTSGEYDRDEYDEGDLVDEEDEDDEDAEADGFEYDEEDAEYKKETILDWFKTDDEDLMKAYLVKMLRAQIASSYPKFGEYEGLEKTADRQGNKKDKLKGGDYVAQGIVEIQRARMTNDGQVADKPTPLTYLPYDKEGVEKTFKSLIDAKKPEALNYYSFDSSKGVLYYATYKEVVVTVDGVVDESASSYVIKENPISYKALASMCSMPFNFTFSLLQVSENPEWVMAVIDLLLEKNEVVLMIQDQMNITIYEEVWSQGQMTTRTPTYGKEETDTDIDEMGMEVSYTYYVWEDGETYTSYRFPPEDAYNKEKVIVTTTYTNTANVFIQKANTWCINFEQSVGDEPKVSENYGDRVYYTQGNDYSDEDIINLAPYTTLVFNNLPQRPSAYEGSYYLVTKKYVSDNRLIHSTKLDTISYTWKTTVLHEKEINHEKFLGLWKNETGAYNKNGDNLYDPNGKEVAYTLPPPKDNVKSYAASDITSTMQEDRINTILELLERHQDTQMHEQLMRYYWNIYYGRDVYDVDVESLLNLFDTSTFRTMAGGIYGSTFEAKIWFSMINAGYSKVATAAAMGNFMAESGIRANNLENSYEIGGQYSLGYTDETYSDAVSDGTYSLQHFISDYHVQGCGAGYGLCQWTYSTRKENLYKYTVQLGYRIDDETRQIEYMLGELGTPGYAEGYANYIMSNIGTDTRADWANATEEEELDEATRVFFHLFEARGATMYQSEIQRRQNYAREIYEKYADMSFGGDIMLGQSGDIIVMQFTSSLTGRTFSIFNQLAITTDTRWNRRCNRASEISVLSGYYEGEPLDLINMATSNAPGDIALYNQVGLNYTQMQNGVLTEDMIRNQVSGGGYILLYLKGTDQGTNGTSQYGRKWASSAHWIAILGYRQTDEMEEIFVSTSTGDISYNASGWYPIDEFEGMVVSNQRSVIYLNEK